MTASTSDDSRWIDAPNEITVIMSPDHVRAYQAWLRDQGLYLFQIHGSDHDDPLYTVGRFHA